LNIFPSWCTRLTGRRPSAPVSSAPRLSAALGVGFMGAGVGRSSDGGGTDAILLRARWGDKTGRGRTGTGFIHGAGEAIGAETTGAGPNGGNGKDVGHRGAPAGGLARFAPAVEAGAAAGASLAGPGRAAATRLFKRHNALRLATWDSSVTAPLPLAAAGRAARRRCRVSRCCRRPSRPGKTCGPAGARRNTR